MVPQRAIMLGMTLASTSGLTRVLIERSVLIEGGPMPVQISQLGWWQWLKPLVMTAGLKTDDQEVGIIATRMTRKQIM